MTDPRPAPLVPPHVDLRNFPWLPLEVVRLRDSDFVSSSSAEGFRAALLLWCACWHQLPAASLPVDDRSLAKLAGYGRDVEGWRAVRSESLYGFVECDDGRLYHRVIAERALNAWSEKEKQRRRTEAASAARRKPRADEPDLFQNNDLNRDVGRNEQRNGKRSDHQQNREEREEVGSTEASLEVPTARDVAPPAPPATASVLELSPGTRVCKVLRSIGYHRATSTHPELLALLNGGVPEAEIIATAHELLGVGKTNFPYLLATVRGRRDEVARAPPVGALAPTQGKVAESRQRMGDRLREFDESATDRTPGDRPGGPRRVAADRELARGGDPPRLPGAHDDGQEGDARGA